MSLFKINIKTKNGNDIKNKQVFNIIFKTKFIKNVLTGETKGLYNYTIIYGHHKVLNINKIFTMVESKSHLDLIMKVIMNMFHIISHLSEKDNINPDFIIINSTDLSPGLVYNVLNKALNKETLRKEDRKVVDSKALEMIGNFVKLNKNVKFMTINPTSKAYGDKYKRSKDICDGLEKQLDSLLHHKDEVKEDEVKKENEGK